MPSHRPGGGRLSSPFLNPAGPLTHPLSVAAYLSLLASRLFKGMVFGQLTYFLKYHGILLLVQAGFQPGGLTVDQVLLLSQSIADFFQQFEPGSRTVLATVDFAKAFNSVWDSAFFFKFLSFCLLLCFVEWMQSCLSDRGLKVCVCNSYGRSFRLRRVVPQVSVLRPVLLSLSLLMIFLSFFFHLLRFLCADHLTIWDPSQVLNGQLPLSRLLSADWWNGPPDGVCLSVLLDESHPFSA